MSAVETEVLKIQVFSLAKLIFAAYLLYVWIPRKVFPQEYIDNSLDRVMFNIIHMVAVITLVFPVFIYLKVFGLLFMIAFFVILRLLFIKYYYKKDLVQHFRSIYHMRLLMTLYVLYSPWSFLREILAIAKKRCTAFIERISAAQALSGFLLVTIVSYALYLKAYRGLVSLVGAVPDMYHYIYWGNLLKTNILFSRETIAPCMWSGPVLIHTTNLLANLNVVLMNNIFPFLYASFMLFATYYFVRRLVERDDIRTASAAVALIFFGIIIPSPLAQEFFGTVLVTQTPEVARLHLLSLYDAQHMDIGDHRQEALPFVSFWRLTSSLPYEMAACFFLVNILFLVKYLYTKQNIYAFLYAETLAIVFSIHGGIAIALLFPSTLIFLYCLATKQFTGRTLALLALAVLAGTILGNTWILSALQYGIPNDIGDAAPFLDKLLGTKRGLQVLLTATNMYSVQLVRPTILQFLLLALALLLLVMAILRKADRMPLITASFITLGILSLYFQQNIGLPKIVDHSRLQVFVTYAFAVTFAVSYHLIAEKGILKSLYEKSYYKVSICFLIIVSCVTILFTPRWIDTKQFWNEISYTGYSSSPYLIYEMEDKFQPFTYTVVSYIQELSQVVSKGYHINTHDFLQAYGPAEETLRIPTEYVFVFVENVPQRYRGTGEYWFRWKRDIMLKLKDWVSLYAQHHGNIRLWYSDELVDVYLIDNRDLSAKPHYPVLLPLLTSAQSGRH